MPGGSRAAVLANVKTFWTTAPVRIPRVFTQTEELLRAGKVDEAEPLVRRALAANPQSADAHTLLGIVLDRRGRAREAEGEYREALRLSPRSVSARVNLGVLPDRWKGEAVADVHAVEWVSWVPLLVGIFVLGVFPRLVFGVTNECRSPRESAWPKTRSVAGTQPQARPRPRPE